MKNRDPWATYLQVSVAKEGNVLEQKKYCSPSWEALREFRWVVFFSLTNAPCAVHSGIRVHLSPGSTPSPPWWVWLKKGIREGGSGSHPAQSSAKPQQPPVIEHKTHNTHFNGWWTKKRCLYSFEKINFFYFILLGFCVSLYFSEFFAKTYISSEIFRLASLFKNSIFYKSQYLKRI